MQASPAHSSPSLILIQKDLLVDHILEADQVIEIAKERSIPVCLTSKKKFLRGRENLDHANLVVGDVDVMHAAFRQIHSFTPMDTYPSCLTSFYHRKIIRTIISGALSLELPFFIKSCETKKFTGFVLRSRNDIDLLPTRKDLPVYVSPVVVWKSEFRAFVLDHQLVGLRQYVVGPDIDHDVLKVCIQTIRTSLPDCATYALDVGVLASHDSVGVSCHVTAVIEMNPPYAIGSYHLAASTYFDFLWSGWQQTLK